MKNISRRDFLRGSAAAVLGTTILGTTALAEDGSATTITFWHAMGGTNGEVLQEIVDDFNASQDEVYVTTEYQGTYDDTITKLKAAIQSGEGLPDITQMYDVGTQFMYDCGAAIAVEDMFESTGFDSSTVMDQIKSYYTIEDKQWSMPFNVSTPMLYYNKDVFEEAGLDPDTAPSTYAEVLEYAQTIVESGAANYGYAQAIYGWFFEQQLAGLGLTYGNNDNGRSAAITAVEFDSNGGGLQILETWQELYESGYVGNYGTTTSDTQTAFFSGDTAMIIESTAILANATASSPFEIGTAYLPRVSTDSEDGGVIIGGGSVWLLDTGNEDTEQAAWKFIEYLTTAEVQAKWSMGTGYFAINEAAYETEDMIAYLEENPNFETAINQLKETPVNTYTSGVLSGVQTEARTLFNEVIEQIYGGSMTPEEGVESLASSVNSAIEEYNASLE